MKNISRVDEKYRTFPVVQLTLQYFGHLIWGVDSLEKTPMLGKIEGGRRRGATEDETVGWHYWLNGHACILSHFSHVQLLVISWMSAYLAPLSFIITWSLLKLMSIESMIPSNHPSLCHPLLLLPSVFPSIRIFSNESALLIRWPNYWNFCFNVSPSNEYSRLIFLRIDWFDLLAVQGTLKNLLQHHSSKASILQC